MNQASNLVATARDVFCNAITRDIRDLREIGKTGHLPYMTFLLATFALFLPTDYPRRSPLGR